MTALRLARALYGQAPGGEVRRLLSRARGRAAGGRRLGRGYIRPARFARRDRARQRPTPSCCPTTTPRRSGRPSPSAAVRSPASSPRRARRTWASCRPSSGFNELLAALCGGVRRAADHGRGADRLPGHQVGLVRPRGRARRPDDLRQGHGRRAAGGGLRRPGRDHGPAGAGSGPVYQAGTLSGNPLATAAGLATLRECTPEVYGRVDEAAAAVAKLTADALTAAGVPFRLQEAGQPVLVLPRRHRAGPGLRRRRASQSAAAYAAFFHAMLDGGVYLPPSRYEAWFFSAAHDDAAIGQIADALPAAAQAAAAVFAATASTP